MKKHFSILVTLIMVSVMLLAACSSGNSNGGSQSENTPPANNSSNTGNAAGNNAANNDSTDASAYEIPEGTTITIVNGGGSSVESQIERYGRYLQEKFPQVNFEFKGTTSDLKIDKMILGGEKFDIFIRSIGSFFYEVPQNGFQYDMTELVEQHDVDLSLIDPVLVESMTSNAGGELWGIPFLNSTLVMYYNKDVFDNFGVDYPTDGMTWDEIYDISRQFNQTRDGVTYVGLAYSGHHVTKLNNFGLPYVDPNTNLSTYDDERWRAIMDVFYTPTQDPGYQDYLAQEEKNRIADSNAFYNGQAAMLVTIVHHSGSEQFGRSDFNWDMVSFPTYKENPGIGAQPYPEYAAIASFSENKDAAMKVIEYLISDEFQMEFAKNGNMPVSVNKDVQAAYGSTEYQGKNQTAIFYNEFAPVMVKSVYDGDVERKITQYINDLANGKIDINTLLRQAKEEGDLVIAEKSGN